MKYIIFLLPLFLFIFSKTSWTYSQCYDYLYNLDITCFEFHKNESGIEICEKWGIEIIDSNLYIPGECFNKEYNLQVYIKNSNTSLKKRLILFFSNNIISEENNESKEKELDIQILENDIKECFKNYINYEKICVDSDIINEKDKELCKELEIKKNDIFCVNLINESDEDSITMIKDMPNLNFDNIKFQYGDENEIYFANTYKKTNNSEKNIEDNESINNIEFEEENNYEDENYDDDKNEVCNNDKKKKDYDNELDFYYNRTRKDCVEYGLEGNYIVCTKYE